MGMPARVSKPPPLPKRKPAPPRPRPRSSAPPPPPAASADATVLEIIPPDFAEDSGIREAAAAANVHDDAEIYQALQLATTSPILVALKTVGFFFAIVARSLGAHWNDARKRARRF